MAKFVIEKATKTQSRGRVALVGPSGSGKTYKALLMASVLGKRIGVIDTEKGSASKYANDPDLGIEFYKIELDTFAPATYVEALHAFEEAGYDVVIIDSLSHAWTGTGGALEMKDNVAARSQSKNSFDAWRTVTPQHNALVDAMLRSPAHIIATMRVKTEYVVEQDARGRSTPRKIGLAPVQRDGIEYEFDVIGDVNLDHQLVVSKSRCSALADLVVEKADTLRAAKTFHAWLTDGTPVEAKPAPPKPEPAAPPTKTSEKPSRESKPEAPAEKPAAPSFDTGPYLKGVESAEVASDLVKLWVENSKALQGVPEKTRDVLREVTLKRAGHLLGVGPGDATAWWQEQLTLARGEQLYASDDPVKKFTGHMMRKPPQKGDRTSEYAELVNGYLKRKPDFDQQGISAKCLEALRGELTRRGCGSPDDLITAMQERHSGASAAA